MAGARGGTLAVFTAVAWAAALDGFAGFDPGAARVLVMARRLDDASAAAARWARAGVADDRSDILLTVERERGRLRATVQMFDSLRARGRTGGLDLLYAYTLGRLGKTALARQAFERMTTHAPGLSPDVATKGALRGDDSRAFAWHHTLEADALRESADTAWLCAIADSVERIGAQSYYARDWQAHHHVRGLLAERQGQPAAAEREFTAALVLVPGFTRTNVELARVQIALGHPERAIATLRAAYREPLDAMGRYATVSEIDYTMALAFAKAQQPDSAKRYAGYVRTAWRGADPAVAARLSTLP